MARSLEIAAESLRMEHDQKKRRLSIDQKDFLPAELEILESPPSPAGRWTMALICLFFVIALAWSVIGKIDVVASATGKIVPIGQSKTVQSLESGLVTKIYVKNGAAVKQGDPLLELDPTNNTADIARLASDLRKAQLIVIRNSWLMDRINEKPFDELVFEMQISEADKLTQMQLAISQLKEYNAAREALKEQIIEQQHELKLIRSQLDKLTLTLPLLEEQVQGLQELSGEGVASRFQYLAKNEELISRRHDLSIEKDRLEKTSAAIRALEKQKNQLEESKKSKLIEEIAEAQNQVIAYEQELVKAQKTQDLLVIRAPIDGVVQQLAIHTLGGVIRSSDALMKIVPEDQSLQVEAVVLNKDIGFVREGLPVEIKLEAFPFTKYGVLHGEVVSIDREAVQDDNFGLVYPARISFKERAINISDIESVPVSPGMGLTAEIKIGQRRLVEFVLSPLFRYKQESLRER